MATIDGNGEGEWCEDTAMETEAGLQGSIISMQSLAWSDIYK